MKDRKRIMQNYQVPRNPELVNEINDMTLSITLHHLTKDDKSDGMKKARRNVKKPTWDEVKILLRKVQNELESYPHSSIIKY